MIWTKKIVQLSIVRKRLARNGVLTKRSWQIKISRARVTLPFAKACRNVIQHLEKGSFAIEPRPAGRLGCREKIVGVAGS